MANLKPWPFLLIAAVLMIPILAPAEENSQKDSVTLITDYVYPIPAKEPRKLSRALALYGARSKAVALAAKYLTHRGLLEPYGKKEGEIFCLAAAEINAAILEESLRPEDRSYYVKIKSNINNVDFIQAEIKNLNLEKKERHFTYREEMEPAIAKDIQPGPELSRAYRYFRRSQWRMAIIYLDRLIQKYPNWAAIYEAKAIAFDSNHEPSKMLEALDSACTLGSQEACNDLKSLGQIQAQN